MNIKKIVLQRIFKFIYQIQRIERRWWEEDQKIRFGSCGKGVRLNGRSVFTGHANIHIGNNVHIGNGAYFRGEGGLYIGHNTHISRNCVIYTMNHNFEGERLPYDEKYIYKPVYIGDNVWIGMNVCIAPGSRIGEGAVIGMGAVVSGEVEKCSIVVSQPLRVVGYRNIERYEQLKALGRFGGVSGRPLNE